MERETVDWVSDGLGLGINPSSLPMMINSHYKVTLSKMNQQKSWTRCLFQSCIRWYLPLTHAADSESITPNDTELTVKSTKYF